MIKSKLQILNEENDDNDDDDQPVTVADREKNIVGLQCYFVQEGNAVSHTSALNICTD